MLNRIRQPFNYGTSVESRREHKWRITEGWIFFFIGLVLSLAPILSPLPLGFALNPTLRLMGLGILMFASHYLWTVHDNGHLPENVRVDSGAEFKILNRCGDGVEIRPCLLRARIVGIVQHPTYQPDKARILIKIQLERRDATGMPTTFSTVALTELVPVSTLRQYCDGTVYFALEALTLLAKIGVPMPSEGTLTVRRLSEATEGEVLGSIKIENFSN